MNLLSFFIPKAPRVMTYMLQQFEYKSGRFVKWSAGLPNLITTQKRQQLDMTARAKLTLAAAYCIWTGNIAISFGLFLFGMKLPGLLVLAALPLTLTLLIAVFNSLLGSLVVKPSEKREIGRAKSKLNSMKATRIAVLGSYGKTTTKEILEKVLSAGDQKVAATPGNKNVPVSHARWINDDLEGDEAILIFEYGESSPGDIAELAELSQPDIAVITGLAAAHMDGYGSLDEIGYDLASIFKFTDKVYVNADSPELAARIDKGIRYSAENLNNWSVKIEKHDLDGLQFKVIGAKKSFSLHSPLIGEHLLGSLLLAVEIASELGLDKTQINKGVAATRPFEHRMQPYNLGGAVVIDDTYNGNLEGMKAGLELLSGLTAKRKIYITPGLVEQGDLNESVHKELGQAIARAKPDKVILMHNSATDFIKVGLKHGDFSGELMVEDNPLDFYSNLEHFVAHGDLVLMQNDWPDSYN